MKLELRGMSKRYGATVACDAVDLEIRGGEVLALLGENGAGKSTLMKMLYGVERPTPAKSVVDGERVQVDSPRAARELGIGMVFQQFSLIPAFSVAENLSLGAPGLPLIPAVSQRGAPPGTHAASRPAAGARPARRRRASSASARSS